MPDPESDAAPSLVSEQESHRSGPREKCQRAPEERSHVGSVKRRHASCVKARSRLQP